MKSRSRTTTCGLTSAVIQRCCRSSAGCPLVPWCSPRMLWPGTSGGRTEAEFLWRARSSSDLPVRFSHPGWGAATPARPALRPSSTALRRSGQHILSKAKVAIIGLGGAGSLLAEKVGRLGVGRFVIIDPDRVDHTNLPRLVGASRWDASLSRRKTSLAKRNIYRANRKALVHAVTSDIVEPGVADELVDCDFVFLAADTMRARNVFNALVHQYLIPGAQVGAKVVSDGTGGVTDVFAVTRLVTPDSGCLHCSGFINATKLQNESLPEEERHSQQYVEDDDVVAPSVITLNASACAQAANDFLFYMTGLAAHRASQNYIRYRPMCREWWQDKPLRKPSCLDCGLESRSRFGRGDSRNLPVKQGTGRRRHSA